MYPSPPGLQLLHCLKFDDDVVGGGSFFIDSFAVAEALRIAAPAAFTALSSIPATFLKDHSRRDHPVLLSYQRPHLAVDPRDQRLTGDHMHMHPFARAHVPMHPCTHATD